MPGFIGMPELIMLGLVTLLVFGPKRLPEMGRSLGRGLREFKDSVTSDGKDTLTVEDVTAFSADSTPATEQPVPVSENGKVTTA